MDYTPLIVINSILVSITIILAIAEYFLVNYGECNIIINKDRKVTVLGGNFILGSLASNKIFIPSACGGKATCGHCKVKVLSGGGQILPTEEVYISKEEKEAGMRLACQVKIKNDIEIYIPEYLLETKEYTTVVEEIIELTHDIKYIRLGIQGNEKINFRAGQYIQFKIPGTEEFRAYSIASQPSLENKIELTIRQVPGGLCSTYVHQVLEVGKEITITGPFGDFFFQEDSGKDIVAIAGGCGMAPIRSILYYMKENNINRKITYFFGARSAQDLFYSNELHQIEEEYKNFKYVPALSEPKATDKWTGETGLITQVVGRYVENADNMEAYLCGPPPMIDASIKVLTQKGMAEKEIYFDKF